MNDRFCKRGSSWFFSNRKPCRSVSLEFQMILLELLGELSGRDCIKESYYYRNATLLVVKKYAVSDNLVLYYIYLKESRNWCINQTTLPNVWNINLWWYDELANIFSKKRLAVWNSWLLVITIFLYFSFSHTNTTHNNISS